MDFYCLLDQNHSKKTTTQIVEEVITHSKKINDLVDLFLAKDVKISQRAAWPISYIAEKKPELIEKNLSKLFQKLKQNNVHDANVRNLFRAIQYINIPKQMESEVLNHAFSYLNNPLSPVAVKVFCMNTIYKLQHKYPEIKNELLASIENQINEGSAGFKSRGNKILKKLTV